MDQVEITPAPQLLSSFHATVDPRGLLRVGFHPAARVGRSLRFESAETGRPLLRRLGLLDALDAPVPFTVTTRWVPVWDRFERCARYINPVEWPAYTTGIDVQVLTNPVDTASRWVGSIEETLTFLGYGEVGCRLSIDWSQGTDTATTHYSLLQGLPPGAPLLARNEGTVDARRRTTLWGEGYTEIRVVKTLQLAAAADDPVLAVFAPALAEAWLTAVLVEFSLRYTLGLPDLLLTPAALSTLGSLFTLAGSLDGVPVFRDGLAEEPEPTP